MRTRLLWRETHESISEYLAGPKDRKTSVRTKEPHTGSLVIRKMCAKAGQPFPPIELLGRAFKIES